MIPWEAPRTEILVWVEANLLSFEANKCSSSW